MVVMWTSATHGRNECRACPVNNDAGPDDRRAKAKRGGPSARRREVKVGTERELFSWGRMAVG